MAGLELAEAHGLAALSQYRDAPPRLSRRMQALLGLLRPPPDKRKPPRR